MITSGEILRVHRGMFSTSGDIMIHVGWGGGSKLIKAFDLY